MSTYFCILTSVGAAKLANATALGLDFEFSEMALGDGGGSLPTPNQSQTSLINEVRRAPLNSIETDPDNPTWIICEQVIPAEVGGWTIREGGIYDTDGDFVAVGNIPETYKPLLEEGSGRTQTIRIVIQVSNTATVTLKIDPSVVVATRKYVDQSCDEHLDEAKAYSENAANLSKGRVPEGRLSGRYDILAASAEKVAGNVARFSTDLNSLYLSNNAEGDVRIGNGYASRLWFDRSIGNIKLQTAVPGLAGDPISWIDSLVVSSAGTIPQIVNLESYISELSTANNARTKAALNAVGDAPIYGCRGWARFNGYTLEIEGSGNVSSITDYGVGDYEANLIQPMPTEFYSVSGMVALADDVSNNVDGLITLKRPNTISPTVNSVRFVTGSTTSQNFLDCRIVSISICG